jgi:hypothetical protein
MAAARGHHVGHRTIRFQMNRDEAAIRIYIRILIQYKNKMPNMLNIGALENDIPVGLS